jgi:hypothetical protein
MAAEEKNPRDDSGLSGGKKEDDEQRKVRRLQLMVDMVLSVLRQDRNLTAHQAHELAERCRNTALAMFPDKELAFDLIYKPRLERVLRERFPKR